MKITNYDYDMIVFLTRLVYYDLEYPQPYRCLEQIDLLSGLKLNMFDMGEYDLYVICGTNGLNDWIANFKVALHITPRQYKRAFNEIFRLSELRNKPIVIAGHSLGGGIAEYVASEIKKDVTCITFNGCGCLHLIKTPIQEVYNIITTRDILNGITEKIPFVKKYMKHSGIKIFIEDKGFLPLSVKSHCNFLIFDDVDIEEIINKNNTGEDK